MSSSKLLKERIESIQDTMKITNAMYLISSSKLRKARQNYQNVSPYFNRMRDTISRVVPHLPEEPEHPFFHERNLENPRRAYLVLTADKGMAGAYNQNLLKFLREHADPNDRFYVIGQVGYRALRHRDPRLVEEFRYSATAPTLQRARDITVDAIDDFKSGKLDEIYIVYTKEAQTADSYIERATYDLGKNHRVRVATSDNMEQVIILGHGALRISARAFEEEVAEAEGQISDLIERWNVRDFDLRRVRATATIIDK